MKKLLEKLMKITGSKSVRNRSELFAYITFMDNIGGQYRLDRNDIRTSERKVFCGRLSATLQASHRKPGPPSSALVKKERSNEVA